MAIQLATMRSAAAITTIAIHFDRHFCCVVPAMAAVETRRDTLGINAVAPDRDARRSFKSASIASADWCRSARSLDIALTMMASRAGGMPGVKSEGLSGQTSITFDDIYTV